MDRKPRKSVFSPLAQWLVFALALGVLGVASITTADRIGRDRADQLVLERSESTAQLQVSALLAELDKQRAVRFMLARDADVIETLSAPSGAAQDELNAKLKTLGEGANSSVIYIINAEGVTIAASNYDTPASFVGNTYQFRPYFMDAMREGTGQLFAMGATSRVPGFYVSERIEGPDGPIGVAVVKIEFSGLEELWTPSNAASYVSDARGVVLITSVPAWQFYAETEQSAESISLLRASLQYLEAQLRPLPVGMSEEPSAVVRATIPPRMSEDDYAKIVSDVPTVDWHLTALFPLAEERAASVATSRATAVLIIIAVTTLGALALGVSQRSRRVQVRLARQRAELENAVQLRTADLAAANRQLTLAIDERDAAETRAAQLRDDLMQSNRLASLGQIAAGVAHEINQPLGAIRAYADNGQVFLSREDSAQAQENFGAIARLTERIGTITEHLRSFARKGQREAGAIDLRLAIAGAETLMSATLRGRGVALDYAAPSKPVMVMGEQTALEQILINLIQNAVDALSDTDQPRIGLSVAEASHHVSLRVWDNGPGIAPDMQETLFAPFSTSKAKGLGLGLVISQDLAQSFGARLTLDTTALSGASFTLTLARPA